MACTSLSGAAESGGDLRRGLAGMRRSRSEPQIRYSLAVARAAPPAKMKTSRSTGVFPLQLNGSVIPSPARSLLFDSAEDGGDRRRMQLVDLDEDSAEEAIGAEKRSNWVERLLELRSRWRDRQPRENDAAVRGGEDEDYACEAIYDSEEEAEEAGEWDRESFGRLLTRVTWQKTKLFAQLAFLCNMAYVIPEIKAEDLRRYYDLRLVTSSLEKKSEAAAAAIRAELERDSTRPPPVSGGADLEGPDKRQRIAASAAYDIAASAASYVHSRAKGLLSLGGGPDCGRNAGGATAAYVAASTMTAVVAAEDEARQEAAKNLRSLHSSPCEWFVCDEPSTCTRYFVIQGSDSLASWQANLLFEPTRFEGTEALVHRGIYEAAKGLYDQFLPSILSHLHVHGDRARLRFTGHSLGGSLSILLHLMLLSRNAAPPSSLLPAVTFGSPSVFCRGHLALPALHHSPVALSVLMHRDIVPRAFSCTYPSHVALVLKRLNSALKSHPCLNKEKLLYSPVGQLYILQPEESSSPHHPFLPPGAALYALRDGSSGGRSGLRAFLNSPHPLEMLSDPSAYGSEGTILRDHDSSNYLKAMNGLLRQHTRAVVRRSRRQRLHHWWPLLTSQVVVTGHENPGLARKEVVTGV